ncbi:MAG TPA: nucleoside triphosphate pyrophosphatase [Sphingomicrobium sp.]|nr:nucleoside triphosphate pyrophosphatase [Sphingomicrobium sp.]
MTLILASASAIRHQMLAAAGIGHRVMPPGIDESAIKMDGAEPAGMALELASAKALAVSRSQADAWVIGGDSVVSVDGRRFDKPADRDQAAEHLRVFAGKTLILTSAVALARDGRLEWSLADEARLQVRPLTDKFIADYLEAEWPEIGYCVGVFRMEGRGVQLFDRVDGSFFTILGMPLLPLLGALRERGLAPS